MSKFVTLSSTDSSNLYPDNKPHRFEVKLNKTLRFDTSSWTVALVEITFKKQPAFQSKAILRVCSNICEHSFVGHTSLPLLRSVDASGVAKKQLTKIFEYPYYHPLALTEIDSVDIYITDEHGSPATFLNQPLSLTLHFKHEQR